MPSQEEDTTLELSQTFDNTLDLNTDSIKDQEYSLSSAPSDQLPPQSPSPSPSLPPTVNIMSLAGYYQSIPDNQWCIIWWWQNLWKMEPLKHMPLHSWKNGSPTMDIHTLWPWRDCFHCPKIEGSTVSVVNVLGDWSLLGGVESRM